MPLKPCFFYRNHKVESDRSGSQTIVLHQWDGNIAYPILLDHILGHVVLSRFSLGLGQHFESFIQDLRFLC